MADDDGFDFADAFRELQPAAERSLVDARVVALNELSTEARKSVSKIVGLTRIAYDIPLADGDGTGEWLQDTLREKEASFSLSRDREDARIMSAIVLPSEGGKIGQSWFQASDRQPIALMQYLIRHITPPGGVVLDPFAGSGTTAEAALREGFDCILMEAEPEYTAFLRRRFGLPDLPKDVDIFA